MLSTLAMRFRSRKMSFPTILRRSLPTWLLLAVPLAAAAPAPWQTHAPLPEPKTEVAAGVARGELVAVGGFTANGANSARVDAYSIARNAWRRLPDLPVSVDHAAAASAGTRVYALGGRSAGIDTNTNRFEVYDVGARRWTRLAAVPQARGGTGATYVNGRIVSVGGERPPGTIASVYAYVLRTKRWQRLPDLPTPRHGLGVVAASGRVWVVAGGSQPGLTVSGAVESIRP